QGEQVANCWPKILGSDLEIGFAHKSFKWGNSAKGNAGVTCVIVGLRKKSTRGKIIFSDGHRITANNITPYLSTGNTVFVARRSGPLSAAFPSMSMGSMARDAGYLILTQFEKDALLRTAPDSLQYIKPLYGSQEFIQGIN